MNRSFYARHGVLILGVVLLLLVPTFGGAGRALKSNRNDIKNWLPAQYEETRVFQWFRGHFGGEEFILASWEGCTRDDQRLKLFADTLRPESQKKLGRSPQDENGQNTEANETPDGVLATNSASAGAVSPGDLFREVMTGEETFERLVAEPARLKEGDALKRLQGSLIGPDGMQTCVVLTLSEEGKKLPRLAVNAVREAAKRWNIKPEDLHLGGPAVDNVAIDEAGERSLYTLAGLAGAIGLVISWWCLRSAKLIVMVFFAGLYGAAASLAVVWYSGNSMNAILLTMPSLVYVATISGAIHLSNYYRDSAREGNLEDAPSRSIKHAALPLSLATATTAIGLLTLMASELVPIQMFGLYSAIGVVVSLLLLFLFLPAAFQIFPLAKETEPAEKQTRVRDPFLSKRWRLVGRAITRNHGWVAAACIAVLAFGAWGMTQLQTSVHLMRLFPAKAKILADYAWLEENLGELVPMEIVLKIDSRECDLDALERVELVRRVQKKVEQTDKVGSALSVVTFLRDLPRKSSKKSSGGIGDMLADIATGPRGKEAIEREVFAKQLAKSRDELISSGYLAIEGDLELYRVSARVGALQDVDYGKFLNDIEEAVRPILDKQKAAGHEGISAVYTGLVPLIYKAQRSLLTGLIWGFVSDFVLITIVMMIAVRSVWAGLILALPSIFPAVMVFGVMGWTGVIVDVGTVMAPSVALGVTVDDVVHFMLKFRSGLKMGKTRRQSVMLAYKGCARAMYQSWGVIGLGLSVFALSPFTPTQRFGYLMVSLLTAALFGNLLLLPALLAGPMGWLFGRKYAASRHAANKDATMRRPPTSGDDSSQDGGESEDSTASDERSVPSPILSGNRVDSLDGVINVDRGRRSVRA